MQFQLLLQPTAEWPLVFKLHSVCGCWLKHCFPVNYLRNVVLSWWREIKMYNAPGLLQVIVKVNNGIRDFSTSVTPKQSLCDGRWHRITGEKSCVSRVFFVMWVYAPTCGMMFGRTKTVTYVVEQMINESLQLAKSIKCYCTQMCILNPHVFEKTWMLPK